MTLQRQTFADHLMRLRWSPSLHIQLSEMHQSVRCGGIHIRPNVPGLTSLLELLSLPTKHLFWVGKGIKLLGTDRAYFQRRRRRGAAGGYGRVGHLH